jgi:uncharacterized protein YggE
MAVGRRRYGGRMQTEITVQGSFRVFEAPERGTVHASVSYEGPAMEPVYDGVARDLDTVKASVESLTSGDDPAVTKWSARDLRTWSTRPWNQDGEQLPLVHHALVDVNVEFGDFTALSSWVARHVNETDGFAVSRVRWSLTAGRREELLRQVRTEAVKDALRRAQQYADALELGEVRPIAIADPGMLGLERRGGGPDMALMAAPAGRSATPDVELVPADIEVSVTVDARFVVE